MDIIAKIFDLMKVNNVSAIQLTKEAKLSNGIISQWKKGLQLPSLKNLQKIADYFHVPLDYFTETINQNDNPKTETITDDLILQIESVLKKLSEEDKKLILDIVKAFNNRNKNNG